MRDPTRIVRLIMSVTLLSPLTVFINGADNLGSTHSAANINVYPSWQAYAGENITIRIRIEALKDLRDLDIYIYAYGSKNEGYDSWSKYLNIMNDEELSSGTVRDENYSLPIPPDASPGLVYATIHIHFKYLSNNWHEYSNAITFQLTYLKNKAYEHLQSNHTDLQKEYNNYRQNHSHPDPEYNQLHGAYSNLTSTHNVLQVEYNLLQETYSNLVNEHDSLNSTHTFLQSEHDALTGDLGFNRNLNYVLVATTIILSAAYLALKKTKVSEKASGTTSQRPRKSTRRVKSQTSKKTQLSTHREREEEINPVQKAEEILK